MTSKAEYYISKAWNGLPSIIRDNFGIGCIFLLVVAVAILTRHQGATGDEPRYMFYSASIWHHGVLAMDDASWQRLSPSFLGYQMTAAPTFPDGNILVHAVYLSALLAPMAAFGGEGLRLTGLAAGLLGLFLLYKTLQRIVSERAALAAVAITALSFPLLTYIHTYWSEVFMFLGVAAGIYQLDRAGESQRLDLCRAGLILLVPFVHLRAAVIAAAIFLAFALRVYQRAGWKRIIPLFIVAGCLFVALLAANWSIYGSFSGSVTTARPPSPTALFSVLAMQMTDIKGIFPYAPIWLLGYAGLVAGAIQKRRPVAECLVFAAVALATSVGIYPGEGWPARFFVVATPMLAVGLAFWFDRQFGWVRATISAILLVVTAAVSLVFVRAPGIPLANRQTDGVFQRIYDHIGTLNPGLFLPIEFIDIALSKWMFAAALVAIGVFAWTACSRRTLPAVLALILVVSTLELTRVKDVPFAITSATAKQLNVSLPTAPKSAIFQFGKSYESYYVSPTVATILVTASDGSSRTIAANQNIMIQSRAGISNFTLISDKMDLAAAAAFRAHVYRSRSVLIKLARWVGL